MSNSILGACDYCRAEGLPLEQVETKYGLWVDWCKECIIKHGEELKK